MNIIHKRPLDRIGFDFIEKQHLPKGKNEYYLRESTWKEKKSYRALTQSEIRILEANHNSADDWNNLRVTRGFDPHLVQNCRFFGFNRIGQLKPVYHEFHNFKMPEGLYDSLIISCDIGDHVCISRVNYLSHYQIAEDVMLANINELACTDKAKFGNGILKDGETEEKQRMVIEVCNENGGRKIIPYNGMLAGDAYMWSKYRDDQALLDRFREMTERMFDRKRGYYGQIGARTIIKNCRIIKDTWIGSDAYIKGANKLKNITINSDTERKSQIGEGCELVNGIVGFGCRIFYGVKAVRFITASHSQLKYGARLINSYLGNNSTISCCEVLNSMIFPAHEQHHNNSFLCASLLMGQSNIAAGATIGSNHNSRGADGEIVAGRGFWPGLCVSLKHNSRFASFTILAKGDYPAELDIPLPFCLVSQDLTRDRLVVMPAYWFLYNMYALARNAWKYTDRDQRTQKTQHIEFDYLAPDTVNEIMTGLTLLRSLKTNEKGEAEVTGWENSPRKIVITKVPQAIAIFEHMITVYTGMQVLDLIRTAGQDKPSAWLTALGKPGIRSEWENIGGQLIRKDRLESLKKRIRSGRCREWSEVHRFYSEQGQAYGPDKLRHAWHAYLEMRGLKAADLNPGILRELLSDTLKHREWMTREIRHTRAKDYQNRFRRMVYQNDQEMENVLGKLEDNSFIRNQEMELDRLKKEITRLLKKF